MKQMVNDIENNLKQIRTNINNACLRVGRNPDEITLVAVTKTVDMDIVNLSLEYGINDVAENKVQEVVRKFPELAKSVKKHMIGHLQRNKVNKVISEVDIIESVDSIRLMREIDSRAASINKIMDILIQVNIGKEENKHGFAEEEVIEAVETAITLENIRIVGLMAMAPMFDDSEKTRPYFKKMKKLFDKLKKMDYNIEMKVLSMGMSGDYEIAIEEGATSIRIGSAIYGRRLYK